MFCSKCGNQVADGSRFCIYCGNPFEAQNAYPAQQPAAQVYSQEDNDAFFASAGQTFAYAPAQPAAVQQPAKKKFALPNIPKKFLLIGCGAVAVLLVVIILLSSITSGGKANYALYLKDGQLFYHDISGKEGHQVTDDLTDGRDPDNYALRNLSNAISDSVYLTKDGKTLFYMDEVDGTGKLFCRSLTDFKKEPVQIASGVEEYAASGDGKDVFYLKNGTIYHYDGKNQEKIAKNVEDFGISDNGDVLYQNDDDVWYFISKGETEKLGSEIDICYVTEKGVVYYQNNDKLYRKPFGKDKEKLVSHVSDVRGFLEDGTFYFTRKEEMSIADFFQEDAEYEYWMKNLSEYQYTPFYELYYFNGREEILLTAGCSGNSIRYVNDSVWMFYTAYDLTAIPKLTYKQLEEMCNSEEYYYDSVSSVARVMLDEAFREAEGIYVDTKGQTSPIEAENIDRFVCCPDGKTVYLMCDVDEETATGTVYKMNVSGNKFGTPEKINEDVCSDEGFYFAGEKHFIYFKNVKNGEGEMFVNGVSAADDVCVRYYARYNEKKDALLFMTDYRDNTRTGTLCVYDGRKTETISDDVVSYLIGANGTVAFCYDYDMHKGEGVLAVYDGKVTQVSDDICRYTFTPDGDLLFLYDYNFNKYRGNLAVYTGGKIKELDEDVVELITIDTEAYSSHEPLF